MPRRRQLLAMLAGLALAVAAPAAPGAQPAATRGQLSWYGVRFAGRVTASGEPYDPEAMTMADRTLPCGTRVRVTANRRSVVLRVNDRGPVRRDRIGDVSRATARRLSMLRRGVADATLEVLPDDTADPGVARPDAQGRR
jgi:rare lipoprotein A